MDSFQAILEASPDAVIVVDRQGVIRRANRNVPGILGYSAAELEGMTVEELLLPEDRDDHIQHRREYMADPDPRPMGRELDLYARHKDGTSVPVEISLGPIEQDGELYVIATIASITKRKERERELRRQNERLEEFASIVSHDLRNPLNVASGRVELAMEDTDSEHLPVAARAHDRMETLIEDLLTLAREGEAVTDVAPVDLAETVRTSWSNVATADATLVTETEQTIRADRRRLQQLLENLLRNAIDHGGPGVTVRVGPLGTGFYLADDGPGIPPDDREQVFSGGYSTHAEGTGFGLAIVREIVDSHGWEIAVTGSEAGGARFEISGVTVVE